MEFAVGGSMDGGAADTMVSRIGLTGLPFTNVVNGCATGGTALAQAVNTIQSGAGDLGIAIGFDKHEKGAFRIKGPRGKDWYGGSGLALTTQFFRDEDQPLRAPIRHYTADAGQGWREGVPQRCASTRWPGAASRSARKRSPSP